MDAPSESRCFAVGEPLAHLGVLVTAQGDGPLQGLTVRASGSALEEGLVRIERVRARPFSARLAPWEASRWERALTETAGGTWRATLDGARVTVAKGGARAGRQVRDALACAVWVEFEGRTVRAGEGEVCIEVQGTETETVTAPCDPARRSFTVRVGAGDTPEVLGAVVEWDLPPSGCALHVKRTLSSMAIALAASPLGERVFVAQCTMRETLHQRPGCAVLTERGITGDARYRAMLRALGEGTLERLVLTPPGGCRRGAEALEFTVLHRSRYAPAPVRLVAAVGIEWLTGSSREGVERALRASIARAECTRGEVRLHRWVPSFADTVRARPSVRAEDTE